MASEKIFEYVINGNLKELQILHNLSPFEYDLVDGEGNTPLHIAAASGNEEMVEWILEKVPASTISLKWIGRNQYGQNIGSSWPALKNKMGYTPVDLAAKNSHVSLIEKYFKGYFNLLRVLSNGIDDPNLLNCAIKHGLYELSFTSYIDTTDILRISMKGCMPRIVEDLISRINQNPSLTSSSYCYDRLKEALEPFHLVSYMNFYNPKIHVRGLTQQYKRKDLDNDDVKGLKIRDKECKNLIIQWAKEKLESTYIDPAICQSIKADRLDLIRYFVEERKHKLVFEYIHDFWYLSLTKPEINEYFRKIIDGGDVIVNPKCYIESLEKAIRDGDRNMEDWCKKKLGATNYDSIQSIYFERLLQTAVGSDRIDIVDYVIENMEFKYRIDLESSDFIINLPPDKTTLLAYLKSKIDEEKIVVANSRYPKWLDKFTKESNLDMANWCNVKIEEVNPLAFEDHSLQLVGDIA